MRARILGAALVLLLVAMPASAQRPLASASLQLPSAPLQTTLPSASLPPPFPPVTATVPPTGPFRATPHTYNPPPDRRPGSHHRFPGCCQGFVGQAFIPWTSWEAPSPERQDPPRRAAGYLQLRVQPGIAQVYVDGFYVGSVDTLGGLVALEEGPHRVELRVAGYESIVFDVRVVAEEAIAYRATLERVREVPKPAVVPAPPKTFYVIPNCYAGDKPPMQSLLPPSCDAANVRTIPPVVSSLRPPAR